MIPQLISIAGFPINSFGLMVALAIFAGSILLTKSFDAYGLPPEKAERYVFIGGVSGLLGARLWFLLFNIPMVLRDPFGTIFSSAGFVFYGGFIVATVILYILSRKDHIPFAIFLDAVGPTMTLGYAIGRVGCQLSGDGDYGMITDSWLGMSYATGVVPTAANLLAYPTPVFESLICLAFLPLLLWLEDKEDFGLPGRRFAVYLVLISIERFFIEFLRIEPRFGGYSQAQYIAVALVVIGAALYFTRAPRTRRLV